MVWLTIRHVDLIKMALRFTRDVVAHFPERYGRPVYFTPMANAIAAPIREAQGASDRHPLMSG